MSGALAAHPALSSATVLGSYALPAGKAGQAVVQSQASSSTRVSYAATGEVCKISSRTVRRAKGLIAKVAAGHAVFLYEASSLNLVQSFVLSHNVQPCTPPLVTLQSLGKGTTLRTTYLGLASANGPGSDIRIWLEVLQGRSKAVTEDSNTSATTTVALTTPVSSLHALASGDVLAKGTDGRFTLLRRQGEETAPLGGQTFEAESIAQDAAAQPEQSRSVVHHLSLLDSESASRLSQGGSELSDEPLAVCIKVTSAGRSLASGAPNSGSLTATSDPADKNKKSRRRKTAMEVIDDADSATSRKGLLPVGQAWVEVDLLSADQGGQVTLRSTSQKLAAIPDASAILDVHMHHEGLLSILTKSGTLLLQDFRLSKDGQALLNPSPRQLALQHISASPLPSRPAALLRLSPSHLLVVLHATSGPSSGKLAALILDTDLEAVIVASDFAMLSASGVTHEDQQVTVSAARVGGSQAVVNVNYWGQSQDQEAALSTFWALPFSVPEGSVLRHAVGKGALNATWLASATISGPANVVSKDAKPAAGASDLSPTQRRLVKSLQGVQSPASSTQDCETQSREMERIFTQWLSDETDRLRDQWEQARLRMEAEDADAVPAEEESEGESDGNGDAEENTQRLAVRSALQRNLSERGPPKPALSHSLVAELLALALPATGHSSSGLVYARKIVSYLVDRQAVSCGMLAASEQGLISRLRARGDWPLITAALTKVPDVGEKDLIDLLSEILAASQEDAAKPESGAERPSLASFLSLFVTLAVSRPVVRSMLYSRVTRVEDVVAMLQVLTGWMQERGAEAIDLQTFLSKEEGSAAARKKTRRQRTRLGNKDATVKVPPLSDVASFTMDLVDVYFPLLLSSPESQPVLKSLSKTLTRHLSACDQLGSLRGPLDAFAKVEADRKHAEAVESSGRSQQQVYRDGRVARPASAAAGSLPAKSQTGGGTAQRADKRSARLQAFESSALIGPYSVELLEL
ncbi:unnamed protein product [Parajaminaea phylloscopi]